MKVIKTLEKPTQELRCYVCPAGNEDVTVNHKTGICSACHTKFKIEVTPIIVSLF